MSNDTETIKSLKLINSIAKMNIFRHNGGGSVASMAAANNRTVSTEDGSQSAGSIPSTVSVMRGVAGNRWKVAHDTEHGRAYYYNKKTKETTWEKPPEFVEQHNNTHNNTQTKQETHMNVIKKKERIERGRTSTTTMDEQHRAQQISKKAEQERAVAVKKAELARLLAKKAELEKRARKEKDEQIAKKKMKERDSHISQDSVEVKLMVERERAEQDRKTKLVAHTVKKDDEERKKKDKTSFWKRNPTITREKGTSDDTSIKPKRDTEDIVRDMSNPTQLFAFIQKKKWDAALNHLVEHPTEASIWVSSGICHTPRNGGSTWKVLPLHASIVLGAPLHLISAILNQYPGAIRRKDLNGSLPIHLAVSAIPIYSYGDAVFKHFLKVYPESITIKDRKGRTPLSLFKYTQEKKSKAELKSVEERLAIALSSSSQVEERLAMALSSSPQKTTKEEEYDALNSLIKDHIVAVGDEIADASKVTWQMVEELWKDDCRPEDDSTASHEGGSNVGDMTQVSSSSSGEIKKIGSQEEPQVPPPSLAQQLQRNGTFGSDSMHTNTTTDEDSIVKESRKWKIAKDAKTGRIYFYNRKTKETRWNKPLGFDEAQQERKEKKKRSALARFNLLTPRLRQLKFSNIMPSHSEGEDIVPQKETAVPFGKVKSFPLPPTHNTSDWQRRTSSCDLESLAEDEVFVVPSHYTTKDGNDSRYLFPLPPTHTTSDWQHRTSSCDLESLFEDEVFVEPSHHTTKDGNDSRYENCHQDQKYSSLEYMSNYPQSYDANILHCKSDGSYVPVRGELCRNDSADVELYDDIMKVKSFPPPNSLGLPHVDRPLLEIKQSWLGEGRGDNTAKYVDQPLRDALLEEDKENIATHPNKTPTRQMHKGMMKELKIFTKAEDYVDDETVSTERTSYDELLSVKAQESWQKIGTDDHVTTPDNPLLFIHLHQNDWPTALARISEYPDDASKWIKKKARGFLLWKLMPLHASIVLGAPSYLILEILNAYPLAARKRDMNGSIPIHLAASRMDHPEGEKIMNHLVRAFPDSIGIEDGNGNSPIGLIAKHGGDVESYFALQTEPEEEFMLVEKQAKKGFKVQSGYTLFSPSNTNGLHNVDVDDIEKFKSGYMRIAFND